MTKQVKYDSTQLSDCLPPLTAFPHLEKIIPSFQDPHFLKLSLHERFKQIHQTLCQLIQEAPTPSFLFSAVLDFFDQLNKQNLLQANVNFATFEFWLNHFSSLNEAEQHALRAKIVGKYLPREEYQAFFPIGMGKIYSGSHFVAAHLSPDIDTMIASFWGWMDAFAARVGTGLHVWCLPDGPPDSPVTSIFRDLFGAGVFAYLARTNPALTLTAMDLVSQKQLKQERGHTLLYTVDHASDEKAIILVDEQGHYLGDWHSSDVERVRSILTLFKACLYGFENHLHIQLLSFFAKKELSKKDLSALISSIFDVKIADCGPICAFDEQQKSHLQAFLHKVLGMEHGLNGTFRDLSQALEHFSLSHLSHMQKKVEALFSSDLFDEQGCLKDSRSHLFSHLQELIQGLDKVLFDCCNEVERLDMLLGIKQHVLAMPNLYLTLQSDVEEMREKMQNRDFLAVVMREQEGSLFPVGIVHANDLKGNKLGTATFRDFCNLEEVRMAPYLEVISVIDHHKSTLKTSSVPTALIGDAQSCNVLIAEKAFALNDKYSLGGMTLTQIEKQITELSSHLTDPSQLRILQRLLQRRIVAYQSLPFYIHPEREFKEYLCFLQAILDDTDLLTKVSHRDVECVAQLLNRLKSLMLGREVEIVHFDNIPRDGKFAKTAAQKILQQEDMYSLYQKVYAIREAEVESNLIACSKGCPSNIFLDTKEQNGCARVGQTKLFASNFPFFIKNAQSIRQTWLHQAQAVYKEKPQIILQLHMMSTIASANEVYQNQIGPYSHRDELWFWIPMTTQGYHHLSHFLAGFQSVLTNISDSLALELLGPSTQALREIFTRYLPLVPQEMSLSSSESLTILRFKAGTLNSRKAMITPFLPRPND